MTIATYLDGSLVFEPETIEVMTTAFEQACADLHVLATDQRSREIIATRVIDIARNGAIDAAALHKRVVTEARIGA